MQDELTNEVWMNVQGINEVNEALATTLKRTAIGKIGQANPKPRMNELNTWCTREIRSERTERKRLNRAQKQMKKRCGRGEVTENECNEAWEVYRVQQRKVKRMISMAGAKNERRIVSELRARGEEGSTDWYKFLRGKNNRQMNVDCE